MIAGLPAEHVEIVIVIVIAVIAVVCARVRVISSSRVVLARVVRWQGFCALVVLLCRSVQTSIMVPTTHCAPLSDFLVLLGGGPDVHGPLRGRTPSHTVRILPAFEKGPGPQFEGV